MPDSPSAAASHALSQAFAGLVAAASPSVVSIRSDQPITSGFVWQPGLIVTADEALPDSEAFSVTLAGGETVPAQLAGRDPTTDLALLRLEGSGAPPVSPMTETVQTGALVVAVGAEGAAATASLGIVSLATGAWRSVRGGEIEARIELDMRLRRSAEGGVVLDAQGKAVGMAVFGPRRRVLVIPSATIARVAPILAEKGRVARGYLGLGMQRVPLDRGEGSAVMVISVDANGPGAAAGILQGDVITAWNGNPVRHIQGLLRALGPESVGQSVTLTLRRAGAEHVVPVTIGERRAG